MRLLDTLARILRSARPWSHRESPKGPTFYGLQWSIPWPRKLTTADDRMQTLLSGSKPALLSRGILGGVASLVSFGTIAVVITKFLGVSVTADDLRAIQSDTTVVIASVAAWVGIGSAAVGLIGNWCRIAKVSFLGDGTAPWQSRGIMGNLSAAIAAGVVLYQSIQPDLAQVASLLGDAQAQWAISGAAVTSLLGAVIGLYGRWAAKRKIG